MAIYAIGDLQGCYDELMDLLNAIDFNPTNDQLLFAGDLINRGPKSLECLEFVIDHSENCKTVLGNHDLHLLAIAHGVREPHRNDTFTEILDSPRKQEIIDWYRSQPLLIHDSVNEFTLVHAGLAPDWSLELAQSLARETSDMLRSDAFNEFIKVIYGNEPALWDEKLTGFDKHRYVINCLTRLRYCSKNNQLKFNYKGAPGSQKDSLIPWYSYPNRQSGKNKILFGHWSTVYLGNDKNFKQWNVYPLDTGCLWGGKLTAFRLEDETWFSVASRQTDISK